MKKGWWLLLWVDDGEPIGVAELNGLNAAVHCERVLIAIAKRWRGGPRSPGNPYPTFNYRGLLLGFWHYS